MPDNALLYMRVHRNEVVYVVKNDALLPEPKPSVFKNRADPQMPSTPAGMSTDWNKYSSPEQTRARSRRSEPNDNGVLVLNAGKVRLIPLQTVDHTPIRRIPTDPTSQDNRSHTDVHGPKSPKEGKTPDERIAIAQVRFDFLELFEWAILPPEIKVGA